MNSRENVSAMLLGRDKEEARMAGGNVRLLSDQVRAGAMLGQALRALLSNAHFIGSLPRDLVGKQINDADAWVLMSACGHLSDAADKSAQVLRSSSSIAAQLGFVRERVAIRIRHLIDEELMQVADSGAGGDKRRKTYAVTTVGRRMGARIFEVMDALERLVRSEGAIRTNAREVDPQRIAVGLWLLSDRSADLLPWIDHRVVRRTEVGLQVPTTLDDVVRLAL